MADKTFTDSEGSKYTAELIPAKVIIRKLASGAEAPSSVCTVDAETLKQPNKTAFGPDVYGEGAAPWVREVSTELLGV